MKNKKKKLETPSAWSQIKKKTIVWICMSAL